MNNEIIVAVFAFLGTIIGSGGGVIAAGKLTNHRLLELEKKVDKHNHVVERMYETEGRMDLMDEKMKVANHRISNLEGAKK